MLMYSFSVKKKCSSILKESINEERDEKVN